MENSSTFKSIQIDRRTTVQRLADKFDETVKRKLSKKAWPFQ